MSNYVVCVTDARHHDYCIERRMLETIGAELRICQCKTSNDVVKNCADADGILLDLVPMDAQAICALHRCKVINRYGVGYDNVDIPAATAKGIQVTNVPDYCMEDVSDHALALLLSCLRNIALRDRGIRDGQWNIPAKSFRLAGKTLGIIGFGRVARTLARKCSGFGLKKILIYDPYVSSNICKEYQVESVPLKILLQESDFISLHMPVTDETRGMLDSEKISWMKPSAILINTSRGALIDDKALVCALRQHAILAAGLDTHNFEPLPQDSPYLTLDNVILTDHIAYNTVEGLAELKQKSAQNIIDVLMGRIPQYRVNFL